MVDLIGEACVRFPVAVLSYCLMPNHFHLVVRPARDGDLCRWMQWLGTAHVRRYHRHYGRSGHVWQGRYKSFPIQEDQHLLTVLRYVERNPVRAGLVRRCEEWPWSSAAWWGRAKRPSFLGGWPFPRPTEWSADLNRESARDDLGSVRHSVDRGTPYGTELWSREAAARHGLESSLRPRGRPRLSAEKVA
jgi:putative transposase